MAKKIQPAKVSQTKLIHEHEYLTPDGFLISHGDIIKIQGEYGAKFKFDSLTTNSETGSQWIDCFEVFRGQLGSFRSFRTERLKRVPKRGKRAKRVN